MRRVLVLATEPCGACLTAGRVCITRPINSGRCRGCAFHPQDACDFAERPVIRVPGTRYASSPAACGECLSRGQRCLETGGDAPCLRCLVHLRTCVKTVFAPRRQGRNLLALGMCYASSAVRDGGQEYRDTVRLKALEKGGWQVTSMDEKHEGSARHVSGSFGASQTHRDMQRKHAGRTWKTVVVDYFYLPGESYWTRYLPRSFFCVFVPLLVGTFGAEELLLPNDRGGYVANELAAARAALQEAGLVYCFVKETRNPLWMVTEEPLVDAALRETRNPRYNANQRARLDDLRPFVLLQRV